ncbi:hypothetical protein [Yoonia sp.]
MGASLKAQIIFIIDETDDSVELANFRSVSILISALDCRRGFGHADLVRV